MGESGIGAKLAKLRKDKGITQQQLAKEINYSDKVISKWEREESLPDIQAMASLAKFYGVSVDFLISDIETSKDTNSNPQTNTFAAGSKEKLVRYISAALSFVALLFLFATYIGLSAETGLSFFENIEVLFSGYKLMFSSANNFGGFILIFSVWLTFIISLGNIVFECLNIFALKFINDVLGDKKSKVNKIFLITLITVLAFQLLTFILNLSDLKIGFYLNFILMCVLLGIKIKSNNFK